MVDDYLSYSGRTKANLSPSDYLLFRRQALEEESLGIKAECEDARQEGVVVAPKQQEETFKEPVNEPAAAPQIVAFNPEPKEDKAPQIKEPTPKTIPQQKDTNPLLAIMRRVES